MELKTTGENWSTRSSPHSRWTSLSSQHQRLPQRHSRDTHEKPYTVGGSKQRSPSATVLTVGLETFSPSPTISSSSSSSSSLLIEISAQLRPPGDSECALVPHPRVARRVHALVAANIDDHSSSRLRPPFSLSHVEQSERDKTHSKLDDPTVHP